MTSWGTLLEENCILEVFSTLDDLTILTFFVTPKIANDNRIKTTEESKNNLLLISYHPLT